MRVTYIKHSGFLVEWEDVACLFDCAEGEIPAMEKAGRLFVFASHKHGDHFAPSVFERTRACGIRRNFILSDDIRAETPEEEQGSVFSMPPNRRRVFTGGKHGALSVTTLGSTDCGVAFVVNYAGRTVYHAGDLHWWAWPDDTPQEEREMKNQFFAELVKIKGLRLDAAFLPLDPRLGGNFWMGMDAVMRASDVRRAFPMHMWDRYEYIEKLRQMNTSEPYRERIQEITGPGQVFEI